jgi:hypothetical protein
MINRAEKWGNALLGLGAECAATAVFLAALGLLVALAVWVAGGNPTC